MDPVQAFAGLIATPCPAATFLLASFAFVPIALLHTFISSPTLRHLYCTVTRLILSAFVFEWMAYAHFFVCILYSMDVMRLFRRNCGVLTFFGTFTVGIFRLYHAFPLFDTASSSHIIMRTHETRTEGVLDCTGAALVTMPSLLELMGYLFCFGLHMTGPFFEFKAYDDWTWRQGIWCPSLKQPTVIAPFFRALVQGILAAIVFLLVSP
ncbi:unnamed protein product [Closterium sp. Yama58-4]|nr:unnamed protein product [Closterium sp. Yama58-4]